MTSLQNAVVSTVAIAVTQRLAPTFRSASLRFDALAPTLMFRNHDEYVTYLVDGTRTKGLAYSNMNTRVKIDWPRAEASLLSPEELRALDDVLSTWGTAHRRGLAEARGAIGRFGVAYAVWKAKREVVAAQGRLKRYVDACAAHRVAAEKRHASRVYDERCEWRNRLARDLAAHFSRLSDAVLRPWRQLRMFKYAHILNENGEFEVTDVRGPRPFIVAVNTLEGGGVSLSRSLVPRARPPTLTLVSLAGLLPLLHLQERER